ncbi:PREDICTED: small proline-rich protein 2B-like [Papilio polytes]|uniref:small proline-rich protein 2B-like n=1 Tax=Papilio polytes TaxID=76194 RepID=UPI000676A4E3|nr:PREDICTED: small proline-rich protein 2B-like [Papilio polytes]
MNVKLHPVKDMGRLTTLAVFALIASTAAAPAPQFLEYFLPNPFVPSPEPCYEPCYTPCEPEPTPCIEAIPPCPCPEPIPECIPPCPEPIIPPCPLPCPPQPWDRSSPPSKYKQYIVFPTLTKM